MQLDGTVTRNGGRAKAVRRTGGRRCIRCCVISYRKRAIRSRGQPDRIPESVRGVSGAKCNAAGSNGRISAGDGLEQGCAVAVK